MDALRTTEIEVVGALNSNARPDPPQYDALEHSFLRSEQGGSARPQMPKDGVVEEVEVHTMQPCAEILKGSLNLTQRASFGPATQMPPCSIRSGVILQEWCHALQKGVRKVHARRDDGTWCTARVTPNITRILASQLGRQLMAENRYPADIEQTVTSLRAQLEANRFVESSMTAATLAKRVAQSFNMRRCATLVATSCQTSARLEDADAVLMMGYTGAGKSTTIHALAGSRFVSAPGSSFVPDPTCPRAQQLEEIRVSSAAISETAVVAAVPVQYDEVKDGEEAGLPSDGGVVLCDVPGLDDTRGVEQAVANEIGIVAAVKNARTVRIVFVTSPSTGGPRLKHFAKIFHEVAGFTPSIADYVDSVRFIWTGYDAEELAMGGKLPLLVDEIAEDPPQEYANDPAVRALLDAANEEINPKRTSRKNRGGAMGFNLKDCADESVLRSKQAELLAYIHGGRKAEPIECPSEVFVFNASKSAVTAVQGQLSIFNEVVRHYTGQFPSTAGMAVVAYVLRDLELAAGQIPLPAIPQCLRECVAGIQRQLEELHNTSTVEFERQCQLEQIMQLPAIKRFNQFLQFVRDAEMAFGPSLVDRGADGEATSWAPRLQLVLQKGTEQVLHAVTQAASNDSVQNNSIQKLSILADVFGGACIDARNTARAHLEAKVANLMEQLEQQLGSIHELKSSEQSKAVAVVLNERVGLILSLGGGLDGFDGATVSLSQIESKSGSALLPTRARQLADQCRDVVARGVGALQSELLHAISVKAPPLTGAALEQSRRTTDFLYSLAELRAFAAIDIKSVELWCGVLVGISTVVDGAKGEFDAAFDTAERKSFGGIEQVLARIRPVCRELGDVVKGHTSETYNSLIESLSGYLREIKRELEADTRLFLAEDSGVNLERLAKGLAVLRGAEWMNSYKAGVVDAVVGATNQEILHLLESKADSVMQRRAADVLSDAAGQQITEAMKVVRQFWGAKELEQGIIGLRDVRERFEKWFAEDVKSAVDVHFEPLFRSFAVVSQSKPSVGALETALDALVPCTHILAALNTDTGERVSAAMFETLSFDISNLASTFSKSRENLLAIIDSTLTSHFRHIEHVLMLGHTRAPISSIAEWDDSRSSVDTFCHMFQILLITSNQLSCPDFKRELTAWSTTLTRLQQRWDFLVQDDTSCAMLHFSDLQIRARTAVELTRRLRSISGHPSLEFRTRNLLGQINQFCNSRKRRQLFDGGWDEVFEELRRRAPGLTGARRLDRPATDTRADDREREAEVALLKASFEDLLRNYSAHLNTQVRHLQSSLRSANLSASACAWEGQLLDQISKACSLADDLQTTGATLSEELFQGSKHAEQLRNACIQWNIDILSNVVELVKASLHRLSQTFLRDKFWPPFCRTYEQIDHLDNVLRNLALGKTLESHFTSGLHIGTSLADAQCDIANTVNCTLSTLLSLYKQLSFADYIEHPLADFHRLCLEPMQRTADDCRRIRVDAIGHEILCDFMSKVEHELTIKCGDAGLRTLQIARDSVHGWHAAVRLIDQLANQVVPTDGPHQHDTSAGVDNCGVHAAAIQRLEELSAALASEQTKVQNLENQLKDQLSKHSTKGCWPGIRIRWIVATVMVLILAAPSRYVLPLQTCLLVANLLSFQK